MRASPSSTAAATAPRSTSARTRRSGPSRCTPRRSCSTYEGDDLRGQPLSIGFWERLRDEIRYDSVEELVAAIEVDVERTRALVPGDALA